MRRLLCLIGRHAWTHHRNPDLGGAAAEFDVCGRCGKERDGFDAAPPQTRGGLA
jgi:hypothetical protein